MPDMPNQPDTLLRLSQARTWREQAEVEYEAAILAARAAGHTLVEIATLLGITHQSLSEYLRNRER